MSNPFQNLGSVPESIRIQEDIEKESAADIRRTKHAQATALSPMVERVMKQLRDTAFKQMQIDTKANEQESYYYWGIGYPAVCDGWEFFHCAIEVKPLWSVEGQLVALRSALNLPHEQSLIELCAKHGLQLGVMGIEIQHPPDEQSLVASLQKLLPPDFFKSLLIKMRSHWRDAY